MKFALFSKQEKTYPVNTFSERIDFLLDIQNIKKIRFYADLKLSKQTVVNWKKGSIPSGSTLLLISEYLNVDPGWLMNGKLSKNCIQENNVEPITDIDKKYYPREVVNRIQLVLKNKFHVNEKTYLEPLQNCVSEITLIKWYNGILLPTYKELMIISEKLRVPVSYIINGTGYDVYYDKTIEKCYEVPALNTFFYLDEDRQDIAKKIINELFNSQECSKILKKDPDEYLTTEDPYENPNSCFDAGLDNDE